MRRLIILLSLVVISFLISLVSFCNKKEDFTTFFPVIEGMSKSGKPRIFIPENLFDYINGEAEIYLSYDFKELAVLLYEAPEDQSLSIEIYRHRNSDCTFGIYSRFRYPDYNFIQIGAQGYYEEGILSFFKGRYLVIMRSFHLDDEEPLMKEVAQKIADLLPGESSFPSIINIFPEEGKIPNSEEFFNKDFLGYPFFEDAFTADYKIPGERSDSFTIFIIPGKEQQEAKHMLQRYLEFTGNPNQETKEGRHTIEDPYYDTVELAWKGKYIWGIYGLDNVDMRAKYIESVEDKLNYIYNEKDLDKGAR